MMLDLHPPFFNSRSCSSSGRIVAQIQVPYNGWREMAPAHILHVGRDLSALPVQNDYRHD